MYTIKVVKYCSKSSSGLQVPIGTVATLKDKGYSRIIELMVSLLKDEGLVLVSDLVWRRPSSWSLDREATVRVEKEAMYRCDLCSSTFVKPAMIDGSETSRCPACNSKNIKEVNNA